MFKAAEMKGLCGLREHSFIENGWGFWQQFWTNGTAALNSIKLTGNHLYLLSIESKKLIREID